MTTSDWRGTVGVVKPTFHAGSLEEFIRLLPEGVGVIPLFVGVDRGSREAFGAALEATGQRVAELAKIGVDYIHAEGAPVFMVHGHKKERELLDEWEDRFGVPVSTSGSTQIDAMRALNMTRIVGITYLQGEQNDLFAQYFSDAGIEVAEMTGIDVPFDQRGMVSPHTVYAAAKAAFLRHPGIDGIYLLGSGWRILPAIELLEGDLEVPVVHAVPARVWSVMNQFRIRRPISGFGRLLEDLPRPASPAK